MSATTGIEWTDATWNPVTGCTKVSAGCDHCYAETFAERWRGTPGHYFENGFDVQLRPDKLDLPMKWRKPKRIFVNSMSDLFHDDVPGDYIVDVFAVMAMAKQHTFQVLTKRHGRMRSVLSNPLFVEEMATRLEILNYPDVCTTQWPLPNVWLGVSTEDQKRADLRIPALLDTPAAVRFISAEPLLGPIDLHRTRPHSCDEHGRDICPPWLIQGLDWVIVGGESGRGARPMNPDWARSLRDQCTAAGVSFLFKQWGEWVAEDQSPEGIILPGKSTRHWGDDAPGVYKVGKKAAGRELDGRTWDEYPVAAS